MQKDNFKIKSFEGLEGFKVEGEITLRLRICIATEEIFGPVRNGGIASTYFHLARVMAQEGHDVTVLYLKGQKCENETIEHWVNFYRDLGVSFIPLPASNLDLVCPSEHWQRRMYDLYCYLKNQEPFDVVHASEWCGGPYYCLLAKQQGLAFERTLFLIKSSSPWIWNRHYGMQLLKETTKLPRMFAERKAIELADIVIGGSAHLLTFMEQKGYKLPPGRTFVQPNIVDLEDLEVEEQRPNYEYGDTVKSDELVFFGRLEGRKGLEVFCDAIERMIEKQANLPRLITFLGKEGSRLPTRPDLRPIEFIRQRTAAWPIEVQIIDSYDRDKAIGYLCSEPKIAVMPSLIENSSMAVYECLVQKIPFIASNAGGTPELVDKDYQNRVLCQPHPEALATKLDRVLSEGAVIAKGTFDYRTNLSIWKTFHDYLAVKLEEKNTRELLEEIAAARIEDDGKGVISFLSSKETKPNDRKISICIYHYRRPQFLEHSLNSLLLQDSHFDEIVVVNDGPLSGEGKKVVKKFSDCIGQSRFKVVPMEHLCLGAAFNKAAIEASGELLVFMNAELHYAKANLVRIFRQAAANSLAAAFSCAFDLFGQKNQPHSVKDSKKRALFVGGDLATAYYMDGAGGSCFMVRKSVFQSIGGFFEAYHIPAIEHEFYNRLMLAGYELDFVPESLYWERQVERKIDYNWNSANYLSLLPFLQSGKNYMENILLLARYLHNQTIFLQEDKRKLQEDKKKLQEDKKLLQIQLQKTKSGTPAL